MKNVECRRYCIFRVWIKVHLLVMMDDSIWQGFSLEELENVKWLANIHICIQDVCSTEESITVFNVFNVLTSQVIFNWM